MATADIVSAIASELKLPHVHVAATVALFDDGNTLPFVARYRKEVTGGLDEEQLRQVQARLAYLRRLAERKQAVLSSIEEQGKLTPELAAAIEAATSLQLVEDLYLPYKPKRRTRASVARERGLQPLADQLLAQQDNRPPAALATAFLSDEVTDTEAALAGARDILAEQLTEDAAVRGEARRLALQRAVVICRAAGEQADVDPGGKYRLYYDAALPLAELQPHQALAIDRGEADGALKVSLALPEDDTVALIGARFLQRGAPPALRVQVEAAIADGVSRLLLPSLERELRTANTDEAGGHAIQVFSANLRSLLLQPPLRGRVVMGIDPGYRTGCKVAVVDPTGKVITTVTIYPHEPQRRWDDAKKVLSAAVEAVGVQVIAIGNGTASRETEQLVAELIDQFSGVQYALVSEAGASVYSASPLAAGSYPTWTFRCAAR